MKKKDQKVSESLFFRIFVLLIWNMQKKININFKNRKKINGYAGEN